MARESEKKAKLRTDQARAFVTQLLPCVLLFFALYRVHRAAQGAPAAAALAGALAGALGALAGAPEALGQASFLGLPGALRLPQALGGLRPLPSAWAVRAGAGAALAAPLAAALWLPWRASPLHGWVDALCLLLSAACAVPVATFYVALAEDAAGDGRGNPHLENMLTLCVLAPLLAAFSPRAWLLLLILPPYVAYVLYGMFVGVGGMLGSVQLGSRSSSSSSSGAGGEGVGAAGKGGSGSSSSARKQHAPGTHRR
jgi:hypothetical protein